MFVQENWWWMANQDGTKNTQNDPSLEGQAALVCQVLSLTKYFADYFFRFTTGDRGGGV